MRRRRVAVDVCIAERLSKALKEVYGLQGYDFVHVSELGGGRDEDWADVFKKFGGEIVLSGDINIGRKPHLQAAFLDAGLICYFPKHPFQKLRAYQQSAYLLHNWELIHHHLPSVGGPSCWAMPTTYRDGSMSLKDTEFKKMEIPKEVLDEVRQKAS